MKEKIWIEKLIELLNEYEIKRERKFEWFKRDRLPYYKWSNKELGDGTITYLWLNKEDYKWEELYWDSANAVLISKKYWFIKWLVENDKIDIEKMWRFKAERKNTQIIAIANKSDFYLSLLMLLSIQDEPIEFLVSILKVDATEKIDKLLDGVKKTCENIWI